MGVQESCRPSVDGVGKRKYLSLLPEILNVLSVIQAIA
jgi:hypothetical protein